VWGGIGGVLCFCVCVCGGCVWVGECVGGCGSLFYYFIIYIYLNDEYELLIKINMIYPYGHCYVIRENVNDMFIMNES